MTDILKDTNALNTNPVPFEEKFGLKPGVLVRKLKSVRPVSAYHMNALDKQGKPASMFGLPVEQPIIIQEGEYFLYVRRLEGKTAWVLFSPTRQHNVVVFNRYFWKTIEVSSRPDE